MKVIKDIDKKQVFLTYSCGCKETCSLEPPQGTINFTPCKEHEELSLAGN